MAGRRRERGGIASLVNLIRNHGDALNYDLITRTSYTLRSVPVAMDWAELGAFIKYLPLDSALKSEMNPDSAYWEGSRRVPMLLADIYDGINGLTYTVSRMSGAKPKKPKPYPRPGVRKSNAYGREAIPIKDFEDWWDSD